MSETQTVATQAATPTKTPAQEATVRVGVSLLERLMSLVGELVLARNQIAQRGTVLEDGPLLAATQRLKVLTTELQESVMKARLQPVGDLFERLRPEVQELAERLGKRVRVELLGTRAELDKTVLDAVRTPLRLLVRHSVEQLIEKPERREAAHKPAEAVLHLRAVQEAGHLTLEVIDDGHGLSAEECAAAAAGTRPGLVPVRSQLEQVGGTFEVRARPGASTTFRIRIPSTLAILPALIAESGGERYAVPQAQVTEVVRLGQGRIVEYVHETPVYRLRGDLLPLVDLRRVLSPDPAAVGQVDLLGANRVVVLQAEQTRFGLLVEAVEEVQEVVVKPLDPGLKGLQMFCGSTILGDGHVSLILDVAGVARRAQVAEVMQERTGRPLAGTQAQAGQEGNHSLLLLQAADGGRMAIELSQVARLEELSAQSVEQLGGEEFVQYRGQIMPLVRLADVLPERRSPERVERDRARTAAELGTMQERKLQVVVHRVDGRDVGVVVDLILDVVDEPLAVTRPPSRVGVRYCAVIGGRVTELLDVEWLVRYAGAMAERRAGLSPAEQEGLQEASDELFEAWQDDGTTAEQSETDAGTRSVEA